MDDRKFGDSHFFVDRSPTSFVCAGLSPRDSGPCCSGDFALYGIPVARSACTRLVPIAIAVTLGVSLSTPCRLRPFPSLLRRTPQYKSGPLLHYGVALLIGFWSNGNLLATRTMTFHCADQWWILAYTTGPQHYSPCPYQRGSKARRDRTTCSPQSCPLETIL